MTASTTHRNGHVDYQICTPSRSRLEVAFRAIGHVSRCTVGSKSILALFAKDTIKYCRHHWRPCDRPHTLAIEKSEIIMDKVVQIHERIERMPPPRDRPLPLSRNAETSFLRTSASNAYLKGSLRILPKDSKLMVWCFTC